ncbi:MAG: mechanosensitive ion channel family protein [Verrucomicrobiota bacterium]
MNRPKRMVFGYYKSLLVRLGDTFAPTLHLLERPVVALGDYCRFGVEFRSTGPSARAMLFTRNGIALLAVMLSAAVPLWSADEAPAAKADISKAVVAQTDDTVEAVPFDVRDKYRRSTPASSFQNFYAKASVGNYEEATHYLNLNGLPRKVREQYPDTDWAKYLFLMLEFFFVQQPSLDNTLDGQQEDGLPPSLDWIADVILNEEPVELLMRRVRFEGSTQIWLFDSETLLLLPELYAAYGYSKWQARFIKFFPEWRFAGIQLWLWVLILAFLGVGFLVGGVVSKLLGKVIRLKEPDYQAAFDKILHGPLVVLIAINLSRYAMTGITVNAAMRNVMEVAALNILVWAWMISRCFTFVYLFQERRLRRQGNQVGAVLLRPALTLIRVLWYACTVVYVAKRSGYDVTTLLAGLGIGGMAVALASQDTLKNIFGSMMVLADKPFIVGQRIIANNYDGLVEEIGIRSTKLRLLNGHQVSIPNDIISRIEIENIGRRPYIRALYKVPLPYDTKPEKLEQAVEIARNLLEDHEGMEAEFPPKAYLNELSERGFSLMILYWYHPADYWQFQEFTQRFNLELARAFENAEIRFALPSTDIYLRGARDDEEKLLESKV